MKRVTDKERRAIQLATYVNSAELRRIKAFLKAKEIKNASLHIREILMKDVVAWETKNAKTTARS